MQSSDRDNLPVIVGGGFAGLAAATAMTEAGVRVRLFEARPVLGGRATAYRDPATGERIDNGHHALAGCYRETLGLLARVGACARLHRPSTLRVPMIDRDGRRTTLALPPLPSPLDLVAGVMAWDVLDTRDRLAVLRIGRVLRSRNGPDPALTVRRWLERHGQTRRLVHLLWEPLAVAALNQSIDDASAAPFHAVLTRMFGAEPGASTLLMAAVPLDELCAVPSQRYLEARGSQVVTRATARILVKHGRVSGVRVGGDLLAAPVVIACVPWHALGAALECTPPEMRSLVERASAMQSAPIVTVNLWIDAPPLDEIMIGLPGRTYQWVFDKRRLIGPAQTHVSMVASGAGAVSAASNDELIGLAVGELREALPELRGGTVRHAVVLRERRATFSLAPGQPGRPPIETPVRGLLLAGDWIDTGLPATIESAVTAGHRAARAALDLLG